MATASAAKLSAKDPSSAEPPAGKSNKLLLIAVIVLLVIVVAGAAWYFLRPHPGSHSPQQAEVTEAQAPIFMNLELFTVNLAGGDHYLQLGIVLQLGNESVSNTVKPYLPIIRNRLLLLLSSKSPADLEGVENKDRLIREILESVRSALPGTGDRGIKNVLFSSMVIQ